MVYCKLNFMKIYWIPGHSYLLTSLQFSYFKICIYWLLIYEIQREKRGNERAAVKWFTPTGIETLVAQSPCVRQGPACWPVSCSLPGPAFQHGTQVTRRHVNHWLRCLLEFFGFFFLHSQGFFFLSSNPLAYLASFVIGICKLTLSLDHDL